VRVVPLSSYPCSVAPSTLAHAARMPHSARAAAVRTPMPTTSARQAYAHPPRFLRPGRPPAAASPDGNPAMQASTRQRPHPARADTTHTPMHATRNHPTGPAHAAAPAAGIPDVGLKGASGPATGIDSPSSVSSAGARGASDEERGSSSSIISMFVLSSLFNCFVFLTGHTVR
jgi:hypothetical protein